MSDATPTHTAPSPAARAPSDTALATATMRALAANDPREGVSGPDYLAEIFLTEEQRAPLKDPAAREWVMKNRVTPGAYEFMIARTAFFDQVVTDALDKRIAQLVLLGAGYDSRPCRFSSRLGDCRVFELDALATQLRKKEMLARGGVQIPDGVRFVPVDFVADQIERRLEEAGFSKEQGALFVWEGVTYYLSAEAVDRVLAAVHSVSLPGNSICFDFASLSREALGEESIKKLRDQMKTTQAAEPTKFGIPEGKLEGFLSARGFRIVEVLGPSALEVRYLTLQDGSSLGKVPALFSVAHAAVA
jgi:methyltransferase (TIGR00027 family)